MGLLVLIGETIVRREASFHELLDVGFNPSLAEGRSKAQDAIEFTNPAFFLFSSCHKEKLGKIFLLWRYTKVVIKRAVLWAQGVFDDLSSQSSYFTLILEVKVHLFGI